MFTPTYMGLIEHLLMHVFCLYYEGEQLTSLVTSFFGCQDIICTFEFYITCTAESC